MDFTVLGIIMIFYFLLHTFYVVNSDREITNIRFYTDLSISAEVVDNLEN